MNNKIWIPQSNAKPLINQTRFSDLDFSNKRLNCDDLTNYTPKWLIPNFILKNTLISFYAMPGSGKSITALFLGAYLLANNLISKIYYIDADNGFATLKNRGLEQMLSTYKDSLVYICFAKKSNDDIDKRKLLFDLAQDKNQGLNDTILIIDSIRNFIAGNMSYDSDVMPLLDALQAIRDYSAGVWFLNHQSKQSFANQGENNKAYKGATAFFDSPDEAYFINKKERNDSTIILTAEPMKQRDDTKPMAIIIDTANQTLNFEDYDLYSINDKQDISLQYAKQIIKENNKGINLKSLVDEIKRRAKIDDNAQICGSNALKALLKKFGNKLYMMQNSNASYNSLVFKPFSY
ncbi:MAG: AAA family ATPase [Campylobacter hyointestinalis]|uniref:AAA family ATPase n=1 Tax=Campylobacter hyointestinalis TaxID=198 RepID=UPI0011AD7A35|nr:AAA family ATPase [Campylobacter hyointestinalis]TWO30361.1 AAA family ATPase [Campylobacter hyointestinalis]